MPRFKIIEGNICDLDEEKFFPGRIFIKGGEISKIEKVLRKFNNYILPGFINSHCHIESSFLSPAVFSSLAISHGTVSVVADCHEIANVFGKKGILWMLRSAKNSPFNFFWAMPSCVPATPFETTPNRIGSKEIREFLQKKEFVALGEMMNFPGVIFDDKEVLEKIKTAKQLKKPIDGHCPGVSGENLEKYISAGISTDHECTNLKEAKEKQGLGMFIQIREGSSAQNLEDLIGLDYGKSFLVTDDLDVGDLLRGDINEIVKKAIRLGVPFFSAIRMATKLPAEHYSLNFGEIKIGKEANLTEFDNLKDFKPEKVWIKGKLVFKDGKVLFPIKKIDLETNIKVKTKSESDFKEKTIKKAVQNRAIGIIPNQILTKESIIGPGEKDILKIAVVNRYGKEYVGLGFVKGFGIKRGALASSVSHDSHNLICIGANDKDMAMAINSLKGSGGFVFIDKMKKYAVRLPLAGLMTNQNPQELKKDIEALEKALKNTGCKLKNPLSQICFLALLVIPELKISDRGLFDVKKFNFV